MDTGAPMFGNVTALEGLQVIEKYRDRRRAGDPHNSQPLGLHEGSGFRVEGVGSFRVEGPGSRF